MIDSLRLHQNWDRVRAAVAQATLAAGRTPEEVTIVGVSKYVDASTTAVLLAAGCTDLGESRPQSLWQKSQCFDQLPGLAHVPRWHLVGHLQRNKVRRTLPLVHLIHSVDSLRLLATIDAEADVLGIRSQVLVEVNVSGEQAKTGLEPDDALRLLEQAVDMRQVQVTGLMAMAGWTASGDAARRQFGMLRELRDRWQQQLGFPLPHLSMGMSNDFAEAIQEGATIVRIGSSLFTTTGS